MSQLCTAATSQLVIIDIQSRLAAAMPPVARENTLRATRLLLQSANLLDVPALVTEQYPQGLGTTEPFLVEHLQAAAPVLCKTCFASSGAAGFNEQLDDRAGRHQLVLAGMEAHVCVLQTALELLGRGYQIFVAADAVCSRNPAHRRNALARLRQAGVIIVNSESVVFEWLRDASHPRFREVSALVKAAGTASRE